MRKDREMLDIGVHHFPIISCQSCGTVMGSHIILTLRLARYSKLDIEYLCLCDSCFDDFCTMKDFINEKPKQHSE